MNRFEHFRELREDLSILLGGVVSGVAHAQLFAGSAEEQRRTLACLIARHPFLDMCYLLDAQGRQVGDNVAASRRRAAMGLTGVIAPITGWPGMRRRRS
ncbi:MAG: hypothetical protein ACP5MM_09365 [Acidithiobacillus sp.]|uniref:hypothetical protein n=1 Tax=Acidithiobacillus sp. TaxID=1872118 RepID=UPI003D0516C7